MNIFTFLCIRLVPAVTLATTQLLGPALGQQTISVGANVQVSSLHSDWEHNEVILAADPNDAKHLLAASMFLDPSKADYSVVTYVSFDGGRTWTPTLVVGQDGGLYGDPATVLGCDGTAYSVFLREKGPRSRWQTLVYRSTDGGKNWLSPTVLPFSDREYVAVDCTNGKYRGRVYINGNTVMWASDGERISGTKIFISEDDGRNFSERVFPPVAGHLNSYQGNGIVLSDGTYFAPFTNLDKFERNPPFLQVIQSRDGGNSFSNATTVAKRTEPPRAQMFPVSFSVDQIAGPFRDRIYAVWTDGRSGRSEILLTYSADMGITWSTPVVVNDDRSFIDGRKGPDDFMGTVAVNREGVVGVTWYDRRDSTNDYDWLVRFAASFDGGNSFTPSVKVSESAFTHDRTKMRVAEFDSFGGGNYESPSKTLRINVAPSRSYGRGGDTAGLAASADGLFHALWIDNRTGVPQVWTAPIKVNGTAIRNGAQEFQNLEDITQKLTFEFSDPQYDAQTNTLSVKAHLVNTSGETLEGPIVVRVLTLSPTEAEILNADNRQGGKGAVWEYGSLPVANKLGPGQRTADKLIHLRLFEKEENDAAQKKLPWVFPSLSVEVLGKVAAREIRK